MAIPEVKCKFLVDKQENVKKYFTIKLSMVPSNFSIMCIVHVYGSFFFPLYCIYGAVSA